MFLLPTFCLAGSWYASPTGSGNGSIASPWSLSVALTNSLVSPGDTLYLRGGNYRGPGFVSTLTGTSGNYVTVRSYTGEWAVITDGTLGTLGIALNNSSTNAINVPISGFVTVPGVFLIDSEALYIVGVNNPTNFNLVRGWNSTTPASHTNGSPVRPFVDIINHSGSYCAFRDFEITSLDSTNRVVGTNSYLGSGLDLSASGHGNKAINLIVHNTGHPGIGFWGQGAGGELNGCIIWGTGQYDWFGYGGIPRGSGVYSQNESGLAVIKNCILFRNFTTGAKVFGETGPVRDFQFIGDVSFQNPLASLEGTSGSTSTSNVWWNGNIVMGTPSLAYVSVSNVLQHFVNNIVVGSGFSTKEQSRSFYTNNTVFLAKNVGTAGSVVAYNSTLYDYANLTNVWDYNTYYLGDGSSEYQWNFNTIDITSLNSSGGGNLKFNNDVTNSWQNWSGYDAHSTYAVNWPNNYLNVQVFPLDYDTTKQYVSVVSTSGQTNATLNLSSYGYTSGQVYTLIDAQNWPTVVATGTYTSGAINLPLNLTNVSAIPGYAPDSNALTNLHTNVQSPGLFNAFVLEKSDPNPFIRVVSP